MNNAVKLWIKAAGIRALKTVAQAALGVIVINAPASATDWSKVASIALVAGVTSLLTSIKGLPELKNN